MVEVTLGRKSDLLLLHLVNGSGHYGNSFFDPALLSDQSVTIPWTSEHVHCENLDEPGNIMWSYGENTLTVTVPRLGAHALIAIRKEK